LCNAGRSVWHKIFFRSRESIDRERIENKLNRQNVLISAAKIVTEDLTLQCILYYSRKNILENSRGGFMKKRNFVTKVRDFFDDVIDSVNIAATERQKGTIQAVDKIYEKSAGAAKHLWKQATNWHYEDRDAKNKNLPSYDEAINHKEIWDEAADWKSKYHQNGIGSPEMKFTNEDGREAVYTKDFSSDGSYELYTDPRYKGTYITM